VIAGAGGLFDVIDVIVVLSERLEAGVGAAGESWDVCGMCGGGALYDGFANGWG
jgi:hypothetical protein